MKDTIFVIGATGNVGKETVQQLIAKDKYVIAASTKATLPPSSEPITYRYFSFQDPASWEAAIAGSDRFFLMRPPHISNIKKEMLPFLQFLKKQAIKQIVFLSVQGADRNKLVPHRAVEDYLHELALPSTIVRPSFFMQNLTTTHLAEIQQERQLFIPAGSGRTNFIDVRDLGEFCATMFEDDTHIGKTYTVTGAQSFSYAEVAEKLSSILKFPITYRNPGPLSFLAYHLARGRSVGMSVVMLTLYTVVKFGRSDISTNTLAEILGRRPRSLDDFIKDHIHLFKVT